MLRALLVISILRGVALADSVIVEEAPVPPAVPVEADPAAVPVPVVPAGRRLSPRNDVVMAAFSSRHNDGLDIHDFRVKAAVPVLRGDGYGGALLLGYGHTHLALDRGDGEDVLELHRFESSFGGGAGIAPGWSLRGSVGTAFSSDLRDSTWHAWQATVALMVQHVLGPSDAVVVGAVYVSSADFLPVLPILAYVHQREGSPFRLDVFLPRHVRAEYELSPRWRGALGVEAMGNTWSVQRGDAAIDLKRAGGAAFAEIQLAATQLIHFEARVGLSIDSYTLPVAGMDGMTTDTPLRAASFAQLAVVVAP